VNFKGDGDADEDEGEDAANLAFLANSPQFQQLREMVWIIKKTSSSINKAGSR
jgi:hypothetical protein